jgi:hypothetical protein
MLNNHGKVSVDIRNAINHMKCDDWPTVQAVGRKILEVISSSETDLVLELALSRDDMIYACDTKNLSKGWYHNTTVQTMYGSIISKLKGNHIDDVLYKSTSSGLKMAILSRGLYSSISIVDDVAKSAEGALQTYCAKICSVEVLRGMISSRNKATRRIVYDRLGPVECLDDMIDDKLAENREAGYRHAPVGYPALNSKTGEIARGPTYHLIQKISRDYLPMLLANRNLHKNSWLTSALNERMDSEE